MPENTHAPSRNLWSLSVMVAERPKFHEFCYSVHSKYNVEWVGTYTVDSALVSLAYG